MANKLTKKQELFVAEYLIDLNATKAAERAGYAKGSAHVTGCELLKNTKVQEQISAKRSKILDKLDVSAERILREIAKMAFFDPRKMFNADGSPKQILELDDDTAASVAGLEVNELFEGDGDQKHAYGLVKKIKLADKRGCLELLGRYQKLFTDKVQVEGEMQFEVSSVKQKLRAKLAGRTAQSSARV